MKFTAGCLLLFLSLALAHATIGISFQMQLGNASGAVSDTNNHSHYLIQRPIETLDYNDTLGEPNWASWDLTADDANGTVNRQDSFAADTNLPPNFHMVGANDYSGSGYDRGHLCPSADRTDSTNDNDMTFLMSNMMPQAPDNNRNTWGNFEDYCRSLCESSNHYELLIICGPSGFTGAKINTNGYVWIPSYTWKIAVVLPPGADAATNRITATNRVIAIKVPNTNGISSAWQNYITSANQIEVDTGLSFFTALPPAVAAALRAKVDGETNAPPAIYSFSPTSGMTGAEVVISGTNFSAATQVTFNGTPAAFAVDSDGEIMAEVPTNAGSGFVSVTTASGTAISTNDFTVLNSGGGTVYAGILAGWDTSGVTSFGPSPLAASTNGPGLIVEGLTRGSGIKVSGSGSAGGWGGVGFTNVNAATAVASNQFVSFSITASNGFAVSFSSLSRFDYYRSNTGPTNGAVQFQVNGGAFTTVTNFPYPVAGSGASLGPIDLSGFAELQNVGASTKVSFRIVNWGGGSAGTWYVYNTAGSSAPDLAVQGTVAEIVETNAPAAAPVFTSPVLAGGQFEFMVSGTAGSNYVVEAATNLASPVWVPLVTNTAPFVFVETNAPAFGQRFYRGTVAR